MLKKLLILLVVPLALFVFNGCTPPTKPDTPTNFCIVEGVIFWDLNENAITYRIELRNTETGAVLRRIVEHGIDLNTLNLPEGDYMVKLQAINRGVESDFTEEIPYHQEDLFKVTEIAGDTMINGTYVKWMGRTLYNEQKEENLIFHSASGFEVFFKGTSVTAEISATKTDSVGHRPYIVVVVDDNYEEPLTICLTEPINNLILAENLADTEHKLSVYKRTESIDSHIGLKRLETNGKFIPRVEYKERKIEVIAASSSTGYGNLSNEPKSTANSDALKAFAFISAQALNAEINIFSASGWGLKFSRWTSPNTLSVAQAYRKVDFFSNVDWDHSTFVPDVVVVNLGTNDWSYINIASTEVEKSALMDEFMNSYVEFVQYLRTLYPNAYILILYGLMNETSIYQATEEIFDNLKTDVKIDILKVNGDGKGSNSHPSAVSHAAIADAVTEKIRQMTNWD
ncbi:MAG: hypothetical protein PHG08_02285 [Bacilli bacterium]|jgi:hypothetical protein|nr:hypothetical protein [Bacilli bacterium]HHU23875.1 SGNH/GDSL hydrolase family protein [Acholeplasmataceae bacterium]